MSEDEFTAFLATTLSNAARSAKDGAIAYVCMDWRHMRETLDAGKVAFTELKNLCVWNKTTGGIGTFYRSKHELVFVYKVGTALHTNAFGLGETGRYRTNVWDYPGISSLSANRMDQLAMHPTVKPVALVADAIKDCSRRGETVLDIFAGSGSTVIAAESCGRQADRSAPRHMGQRRSSPKPRPDAGLFAFNANPLLPIGICSCPRSYRSM